MCGRFTLKTPATEIARQLGIALRRRADATIQIARSPNSWRQFASQKIRAAVSSPCWQGVDPASGQRFIDRCATDQRPLGDRRKIADVSSRVPPSPLLILADGFYEWRRVGRQKQPFYIRLGNGSPFAMAGLWERWQPGPQQVDSCTILTTTANSLVAELHNRMPVILHPADYDRWLDPPTGPPETSQSLLVPYASQEMEVTPVSDWVNVASHEGPRCLAPPASAAEQQQSFDFDA